MTKRSHRKSSKQKEQVMTGTLRIHPRGFGFVTPDDPSKFPEDVFIPKHLTDNAVDGDRVEVAINPKGRSEKGPDGKIIEVTQRGRTHVAGIISNNSTLTMAFCPILGESRPVIVQNPESKKLKIGDRVICKIMQWGDQKHPTICELDKIIGHIQDATCDIPAAIQEYEIKSTFPTSVVKEAKTFGEKVNEKEAQNRLDLTKTICFTIDPETAKDFDDALSITKDEEGNYFLGVHIADVAHYVPPGSLLDKEALKRSNSTYFPGKCVPMLPEELSNNLCSLKEQELRLTVSVLMEFNREGTLKNSSVKRSCIRSKKRYTYGDAKKILDGKKKSPHKQDLHQMVELCELLKKKRNARGSIDFAMPELILIIDEKTGIPTGTKTEEYDITHQLVEEFMLKANEVVAKHLSEEGKELIFRIHEEPKSENLEDFFQTARAMGFPLPPKPSTKDLQKLFEKAKKTPYSQQLAVSFIRTLKLAFYSPRNVGHYGLALEHYCHFTSPIRRYSDLVVGRLLFNEEDPKIDLHKVAEACSEKERLSFKAEMSVKKLKKLRLLLHWMKENPSKTYPAYITRIKQFGFAFEMKELGLEGFVHVSELENDFFNYDPNTPMLQGRATGKKYLTSDEILVRPDAVDLIHQEATWEVIEKPKRKKKKS